MYKKLDSPISAHFELNTSCNHSCLHCYNYWRGDTDFSDTSISENQLYEVANKLNQNKILSVILTGGEPLINKKIVFKAIDIFQSEEIRVSLNSNGTLITKDIAKQLKSYGLSNILISLLSSIEDEHNLLSNKNNYKKVINGIKNCILEDIPVSINMVVSKYNLKSIYETGKFVQNLGVKTFAVTRVIEPKSNCHNFPKNFAVSNEDLKFAMSEMMKLYNEGLNINTLIPFPLCFFDDLETYQVLGNKTCSAGKTSIAISSTGEIRACPHNDISYGNIFTLEMNNIWNSMDDWRNGSYIPSSCKSCPLLKFCGAGCRVSSEFLNGEDELKTYPTEKTFEFVKNKTNNKRIIIDVNSKLYFNKNTNFREDSNIGIISINGMNLVFVTLETFHFLKNLFNTNEQFSIKELLKSDKNHLNYLKFFNQLYEKNIIYQHF